MPDLTTRVLKELSKRSEQVDSAFQAVTAGEAPSSTKLREAILEILCLLKAGWDYDLQRRPDADYFASVFDYWLSFHKAHVNEDSPAHFLYVRHLEPELNRRVKRWARKLGVKRQIPAAEQPERKAGLYYRVVIRYGRDEVHSERDLEIRRIAKKTGFAPKKLNSFFRGIL